MTFHVNNNGQLEIINVEKRINELLDTIETKENKRLTNDEMKDISNAYINMLRPYIVKVIE